MDIMKKLKQHLAGNKDKDKPQKIARWFRCCGCGEEGPALEALKNCFCCRHKRCTGCLVFWKAPKPLTAGPKDEEGDREGNRCGETDYKDLNQGT